MAGRAGACGARWGWLVGAAALLFGLVGCGIVDRPAGLGRALYADPANPSTSDEPFVPDDGLLDFPTMPPSFAALPSPSATASPLPTPRATAAATPSAFGEAVAVSCGGRPTAEQVIAVVRKVPNLLPASAAVTVRLGPMCAGTWQYTVLAIAGREPLQVVTRGAPGALEFLTAGTNVCTVEVTTGAPPGVLSSARC